MPEEGKMINKIIAKLIPVLPERLVWIFSKKYIAGKSLDEGLRVVTGLNKSGIAATMDILGESVSGHEEAIIFRQQYFEAIQAAAEKHINTSFSLKPTMFGLQQDLHDCYILIRQIVEKAQANNFTITIDMEDSSFTNAEIELFVKLYREFPTSVGIVLQACLKRTYADLQQLAKVMNSENPIDIRLCKGIYIEPAEISFTEKDEINKNYILCLEYMMRKGFYPAIATHDKKLVNQSQELIRKYKLNTEEYEFQMLYGVTPNLRNSIVSAGHKMRVYVPYGTHWFRYSTRRLKENPHLVKDIIIAFFHRG